MGRPVVRLAGRAGGAQCQGEPRALQKWVPDDLKAKAMVDIEELDLEVIVERLDNAVAEELITWKTACNAWGTVTKMFNDAMRGKKLALRVLKINPCGNAGPERGEKKAKVRDVGYAVLAQFF